MYVCEHCGFRDEDWANFRNVRIGFYEYSSRYICKDYSECQGRIKAKEAEDAAWCRAERGAKP
jgi:hypothetical protein